MSLSQTRSYSYTISGSHIDAMVLLARHLLESYVMTYVS
ncbi:hypothetical protein F383_24212 [Gossypium arboreum]|uniref:Uncharacterized protein n=1 Tax=Gossypium arboreum TaxID=29729 RepID=A0A0B0P778_GOSAR|nr:hypothetical protein F383_24212 [Gossypium arboreum]